MNIAFRLFSSAAILLAILLSVPGAFGQVPQGFSYQAIARDAVGNVISEKPMTLRAAILKRHGASTQLLYREQHETTTNAYGLVTLTIGQGRALEGRFSAISWAGGDKWIRLEIDPNANGRYLPLARWSDLPALLPRETLTTTRRLERDLWDLPLFFVLIVLLAGAEWLLRRRWNMV